MRLIALATLALLATGCAAPAVRQSNGLVDAFPVGVHRIDPVEIHVHEDKSASNEALLEAYDHHPAVVLQTLIGGGAYGWASEDGSEIHIPAPESINDPAWLCALGHELAHVVAGHWHPPGALGVDDCGTTGVPESESSVSPPLGR